jgi:hypothetical protein
MIRLTSLLIAVAFSFLSCSKTIDNTGTCTDGILNQGEQNIDCGGPCPNYCESCADGIRNQGEEAVDCGGPCDPCYPRVSAKINGSSWTSTSRNANLYTPTTLRIFGTGPGGSVTLIYSGPFTQGMVSAGNLFIGEFRDESGRLFTSANSGRIIFTTFNTADSTVSGTYEFIAKEQSTNAIRSVTKGVFTMMEY